jgi:hypothetical protein
MVPMFRCGFPRSNFSFAIAVVTPSFQFCCGLFVPIPGAHDRT